jgi:hypothetical protein
LDRWQNDLEDAVRDALRAGEDKLQVILALELILEHTSDPAETQALEAVQKKVERDEIR